MNLDIQEYMGFEVTGVKNTPIHIKEALALGGKISADSIMVDIEGIHAGPTRNCTWYTEECLKSSIKSWTAPYPKPLIMHHNEENGKIIGRVLSAEYKESGTKSGTPALVFTVNVPDKDGMEQIEDGRLHTVSIGAIVHEGVCSICGEPIADEESDEFCGHSRGNIYDGKMCYWKFLSMEAKELSYVIVPSDKYAQNIRIYKPETKKAHIRETFKDESEGICVTEKAKTETVEVKESQEIEEVVEKSLDKDLIEVVKEEVSKVISHAEDKIETAKIESDKAIEEVKAEISSLKSDVEELKSSLEKEKNIRQVAEEEALKAKKQAKESLVDQLVLLKKQAGKTVASESYIERSIESIKDSIADAKEELSGVAGIAIPENPGLSIKESATSNTESKKEIDLVGEMQNLFSGLMSNNMR